MRRPSFQFYPSDWRNNSNLGRCSDAARGAWVDVLCVLHDSDEYGVVRWPLEELAMSSGKPLKLLRELVDKNVLKGCDSGTCDSFEYAPRHGRTDGPSVTLIACAAGPVWYSSRMVRDEYVRTHRGEGARFDSPKGAPKPSPKGGIGADIGDKSGVQSGDGASSSSSSSSKNKVKPLRDLAIAECDLRFARWWAGYPKKDGKADARKAWAKLNPDESMTVRLAEAVASQCLSDRWTRDSGQYIPNPATWLNRRRWEDEGVSAELVPDRDYAEIARLAGFDAEEGAANATD